MLGPRETPVNFYLSVCTKAADIGDLIYSECEITKGIRTMRSPVVNRFGSVLAPSLVILALIVVQGVES